MKLRMEQRKRYISILKTFIFVVIFGTCFLVLTICFTKELLTPFRSSTEVLMIDDTDSKTRQGYLVFTPGCKIQDFDPFDKSISNLLEPKSSFKCLRFKPLFRKNLTHLTLDFTKLKQNYKGYINYCLYTPIIREKEGLSDDEVSLGKSERFFESVEIKHEFVKIECFDFLSSIYEDYFPFPIKKQYVESRAKLMQQNNVDPPSYKPINVIVVGIDSVSRLNFVRYCPKTYNYLINNMKAFELKGYNKIADNTFVNLVPILTGKYLEELPWDSRRSELPLDEYQFVWKDFAQKGYRTLFAEDAPQISTFNYVKAGFFHAPTDYYLRPFYLAFEKSQLFTESSSYCLGSRFHTEVVLDYLHQYSKTFNSEPHFAFSFISSLTHDKLSSLSMGDETYLSYFQKLMKENLLNNTVLFVLSDHGIRFGLFRQTYIGRMEERLPAAFVIVPPYFYKKYPHIIKSLKKNSARLSTPFDIYQTFKDIIYFSPMNRKNVSLSDRGISLFNEIPENRTCQNASILPHWCTCQEKTQKSIDELVVKKAAKFILDKINEITKQFRYMCAELSLKNIKEAWSALANEDFMKFESSKGDGSEAVVSFGERTTGQLDLTVLIETDPGGAIFEGTVRSNEDSQTFLLMGDISRLNIYGNQSSCVKNYFQRLYCFCKQ